MRDCHCHECLQGSFLVSIWHLKELEGADSAAWHAADLSTQKLSFLPSFNCGCVYLCLQCRYAERHMHSKFLSPDTVWPGGDCAGLTLSTLQPAAPTGMLVPRLSCSFIVLRMAGKTHRQTGGYCVGSHLSNLLGSLLAALGEAQHIGPSQDDGYNHHQQILCKMQIYY